MTKPSIDRGTQQPLARRLIASALLAAFFATPPQAIAQLADIANSPISSAATTTVPPNVMFILDNSGSMGWEYMPDNVDNDYNNRRVGGMSHLCNTIYYNPNTVYLPPKNADGTDFADSPFNNARRDGFPSNSPSGTYDLRDKFKPNWGSWGDQRGSYFRYTGTGANDWDSLTPAQKDTQCKVDGSGGDGTGKNGWTNGNWTKVEITGTEEQNFANWFTFYRTRLLLMKTAAGRAFNGLNDTYRVGFITICTDGSDCSSDGSTSGDADVTPVLPAYYLKIDAFSATHKADWYTKFYQQLPTSFTPLRQALSRVGRHYAGYTDGINSGMNEDPIQYSCQQNFAILTTDGYWNTSKGKNLTNGTSGAGDIGEQDANSGISPRPMFDGGPVTTVLVERQYTFRGGGTCTLPKERARLVERTTTTPQSGSPTVSTSTISNSVCVAGPFPTPWTVVSSTTTAAGSTPNTLADVAAYYYQTDLRPGMIDNLTPAGSGVEDDTAKHQHMTTFTLGLGLDGQLKYDPNYRSGAGDFAALRSGAMGWPNPNPASPGTTNANDQKARIDDLWHAAVNGRGQYFSAKDPTSLASSLTTALTGIQARLASAAAAATSTLEPTVGDNLIILPTYTTQEWTGELRGFQIDLDPASPNFGQLQGTPIWTARSKLDARTGAACDGRTIKLFRSGAANNLVDFTWNTQACDAAGAPTGAASTGLDTTEQAFFTAAGTTDEVQDLTQWSLMTDGTSGTANQKAAAAGANLVNFVRGQRGREGPNPFVPDDLTKLYRQRVSVLGDIVNSQPLYVRKAAFNYGDTGYAAFKASVDARAPMVYVAANDGMLHAFTAASDATGGEEAWAFIPRAALPRLYKLADTNYANLHEYYVDGRPVRDDVYDTSSGTWRTILVGGLNKGGRGYYALDITDPTTPKALWEFSHSPSVCTGAGEFSYCHLGYTFGNPVISKLADGRWVVFVTSGYNNVNTPAQSGDGVGYLYVLNAMTGEILYKISTGVGSAAAPSGLSKITAWVNNADVDNTTLRVYGVDLTGNLWRFDVNDTQDGAGNPILPPAGRDAVRLATLRDPAGNPQPITVAPRLAEVGAPPVPFVFVATGKYIGVSDVTDTQVQSIYAIKDPLAATGYSNLRVALPQISLPTGGARTATCATGCDVSNGWFADLPDAGERVNVAMELQLGTLVVASNVPANSPCEPGGFSYLNFFAIDSGLPPAGTSVAQARYRTTGLTVGLSIVKLPDGTVVVYRQKHTGEPPAKEEVPIGSGAPSGKRVTWRELMQ
jgi:type IV pilus assembly protein PilY1